MPLIENAACKMVLTKAAGRFCVRTTHEKEMAVEEAPTADALVGRRPRWQTPPVADTPGGRRPVAAVGRPSQQGGEVFMPLVFGPMCMIIIDGNKCAAPQITKSLGLLKKFILNLSLEIVLLTKLDLVKVIEIFLKIMNNKHDFYKKILNNLIY